MSNDRAVYESLLRLTDRLKEDFEDLPAICVWVRFDTELPAGCVHAVLFPHFKSWPKFSGNPHYPITVSESIYPERLYDEALFNNRNFWDSTTQYGANRRELLIHLIHHLLLKIHADEEARTNTRISL